MTLPVRLGTVDASKIVDTVTLEDGHIVPVVSYGGPAEFVEDRDIWERQPEETGKAWEVFQIYRDTPPGLRSFRRSWRKVHPNSEYQHNWNMASSWVVRWRWRERANAHDIYMDRKHLATLEADRLQAMREATVVGRALRRKALEAAQALQATMYEEIMDLQTGEVTYQLRASLNPNEIVKLAQVGVALEREALGLDVHVGRGGTQVNVAIGMQTLNLDSDRALQSKAAEILKVRERQFQILEGERGEGTVAGNTNKTSTGSTNTAATTPTIK